MRTFFIPSLIFLLVLVGCKTNQNGTKSGSSPVSKIKNEKAFKLIKPADRQYISPGAVFELELTALNDSVRTDSVQVLVDGNHYETLGPDKLSSEITLKGFNPGEVRLLAKIYIADNATETHSCRLRILSDIQPENYSYKVLKTYPHDKGAYTQGLEYVNGFIYEGTGNYGESSVRKLDLESGEILKYRNLSSDFFGEGITLLNGKIYQVTYRKQVGFVYDEKSFEPERKIFYQNKEGWGLCNNGDQILMSDGSHVIYFMDTAYFSVEKTIEVFDDKSEVSLLNELELIDGTLYANRYTTKEIVMIDPETGKVTGKIDMSGIPDPADRHPRMDYFNGIAYDHANKRIFVTGKYWNKIYEVVFIRK